MNALILNRDFQHPADGWYMIEPKGEHPNQNRKIVQVIDDAAATCIVDRFNLDAAAPEFAGMLIDREHFKHDADKDTVAYGWLQKLQNRADGIYGQIRWTNTGKAAVDGGDYRFFSTEYDPRDLKVLNFRLPRARPMRLDGLTLTNSPNNKGGKPITNRGDDFRPGSEAEADNKHIKNNSMKSIATKLGLSAEASEESIVAEVEKIINKGNTAAGEATTLKNRVTELETKNTELATSNTALMADQVEGLLGECGVKDEKLRNRLKPVLAPLKNRQERLDYLADFGFKPGATPQAASANKGKVLNRGEMKAPKVEDSQPDEQKFVTIVNRHKATGKTKGQALELAMAEDPEAYQEWCANGAGKL